MTVLIWQLQTVGVIFTVLIVHVLLQARLLDQFRNSWVKLLISALIGSAVYSPVGLAIDIYLAGETIPKDVTTELFDEFMGYAPPTALIWMALNTPWLLGYKLYKSTDAVTDVGESRREKQKPSIEPVTVRTEPKANALFELMPASIGNDIIYIEAELHYLKVVTVLGECMVLFSLREASTLLPSDTGFMCHRSYWVSKAHIRKFRQMGRLGKVTMSNDTEVPVSKRKLSDFKSWAKGEYWLS
ncbi:LytTR family DNA-binding domain-containing protein [Thalassotalea ponticola]|uniref:LytTR family DNA-binding domain-containing protein n=1 Tax=Thalassotalea ponticola TaxID=1523392 RepID=UPI0025B2F54B|nr:LytTR family DNA-binding domain-containing protein [Thalassotalea ponticola]MDN3653330.1 LytTR family DNA-binding domain-containing protein [Thalassotalea ponticola]